MTNNKIISEFKLRNFGQKGWMRGEIACPECDRNDKFGIIFSDKGGVGHCFHCSFSIGLFGLMKRVGRLDLINHDYEFEDTKSLRLLTESIKEEEYKQVDLPIGFRRIHDDYYLNERGFTAKQYEQFGVGVANLDPKTENKIVFQIFQRGVLTGWLARSRESKEWHKENLRRHKEEGKQLVLRYRNSNNDFSKMLGGLDDISETHTELLLVEGLFDKANVDNMLNELHVNYIACGFTFGSDLSPDQAALIPIHIKEVILLYDLGTINNMKEAGGRLMTYFNVSVMTIDKEGVDPGNMDTSYFVDKYINKTPFMKFFNTLASKKLK